MVGLFQPLTDVDKGKGVDDPVGDLGAGKAIEMVAPVTALFDQAVRTQHGKVLRYARGGQIKRGGEAAHVLFLEAQFLDQAEPIGMREQPEHIGKFARYNQPTWHESPCNLQRYADVKLCIFLIEVNLSWQRVRNVRLLIWAGDSLRNLWCQGRRRTHQRQEREHMNFELDHEHAMLKDLVAKFVRDQLMPYEATVIARENLGQGTYLNAEETAKVDVVSRELGLWGLDAPEEVGGMNLPMVAMVGVSEELGKTVVPYYLPPDSPNLRMLMVAADERQREAYLEPYVRGETISAIGISEPGAGTDPQGMITTAVQDGDDWIINGRKIWITKGAEADFTILMAVTDKNPNGRNGMSAFLVDRNTPGFNVLRKIPMIDGTATYEIALDDCRVPGWKLLGKRGQGFAPMQVRLGTRRIEMASWSIGMAQRAMDMMIEYAPQRTTFGKPLSARQTVQNWIADAATKIHAMRLMTYDCAWKIDEGRDTRSEISMIKSFCTESAYEIVDHAMQMFGGMGMTRELPLYLMSNKLRTMRIYDGPSEIHNWVVARGLLGTYE